VTQPVAVLLVDDHAVVREGYRRLLERDGNVRIVGEAADGLEALALVQAERPDVVVMDLALPGGSGIEVLRRMLARDPKLRVLMFSMYGDAMFARRALDAGAVGYLSKMSAPELLVRAITEVAEGRTFLSPDVAEALDASGDRARRSVIDALSAKEFEVLRLIVQGRSPREIGAALGVSEKTVANHQSSIRDKLGVRNAIELLRRARELGLLDPSFETGGGSSTDPRPGIP